MDKKIKEILHLNILVNWIYGSQMLVIRAGIDKMFVNKGKEEECFL